jgi:hypothetical protein
MWGASEDIKDLSEGDCSASDYVDLCANLECEVVVQACGESYI